jgi:hypothetical protein
LLFAASAVKKYADITYSLPVNITAGRPYRSPSVIENISDREDIITVPAATYLKFYDVLLPAENEPINTLKISILALVLSWNVLRLAQSSRHRKPRLSTFSDVNLLATLGPPHGTIDTLLLERLSHTEIRGIIKNWYRICVYLKAREFVAESGAHAMTSVYRD